MASADHDHWDDHSAGNRNRETEKDSMRRMNERAFKREGSLLCFLQQKS